MNADQIALTCHSAEFNFHTSKTPQTFFTPEKSF